MSASTFIKTLNCIRKENDRAVINAKTIALKQLEGDHKDRIFVKGRGENSGLYGVPPAANPPLVGVYGRQHGKKRLSRGRQVSRKDLVFRGDLLRNIQVGTSSGDIVYGFLTDRTKIIAEGQEDQTGRDIFNVTGREAKDTSESFADEYRRQIKKCIQRN